MQAGLPDVEEDSRTSKAEDGQEPLPAEGALPQPRTTPRAARVAELVDSACRHAEMVKLLCREQGGAAQTDCLHTLLQTLQWQLALALVSWPSLSPHPPHVGQILGLHESPAQAVARMQTTPFVACKASHKRTAICEQTFGACM